MTTCTKKTTATKTRTCSLRQTDGGPALVIHQQTGKGAVTVDAYYLSPVAGGFRLSKTDGIRYTVCLDGSAEPCTCPGHVNHGHKGTVCKHVASLRKLIAAGKLTASVCSSCGGQGGSQTGDVDADGTCRLCGE